MAWDLFPLKDKIALALFTLSFLDIRGPYEKPAAEVHWNFSQQTKDTSLKVSPFIRGLAKNIVGRGQGRKQVSCLNKEEGMLLS